MKFTSETAAWIEHIYMYSMIQIKAMHAEYVQKAIKLVAAKTNISVTTW
jgi:hypothetical protein